MNHIVSKPSAIAISFLLGFVGGILWSAVLWAFIPAGGWILILPLVLGTIMAIFTWINYETDPHGHD